MSSTDRKDGNPSAAAQAEAAVWVARLHGPNRTGDVETGLRRWLAEDNEHLTAFEQLTDTWEQSVRLRRRPVEEVASWELTGFRLSFSRAALAIVATVVLAVAATVLYLHSNVISTGFGELRTLTLADRTRVHMNWNTSLVVHYDKALRQVRLESGEAFFHVAKDPRWPFVVTADGRRITALGTEFDVHVSHHKLTVTLVEGKVTVAPVAGPGKSGGGSRPGKTGAAAPRTYTLSPGERLSFSAATPPKIDRPRLAAVTAWERGQVVFDDTSLASAVAQMNRYSHVKILIADPAASAIRVSGVFGTGDSANFVAAVTKAYQLKATAYSDRYIILSAEPNSRK